ncbi:MAG: TVP38/TMEM64 family protein [Nitrospira sp.]|nr:TVP38/TMEM64 family protein [Nitrospira sp.]MCP9464725.1 TVP38/TMEM64 family protein [Nitrospira sp.]
MVEPIKTSSKSKIALALGILFVIGAVYVLDLGRYLSLEIVKEHRDRLLAFTEEQYTVSVALFILTYVVVAGLALPGAAILTLTGGFLFGSVWGTLFVNIGATTGATLAFLTARYLLREWVEEKFGAWVGPLQDGIARNAFNYLLTLRLIPIVPFFALNLVAGLTRIGVKTYVSATALGIIPGSFVYAYAGRQLGSINSLQEIVSPEVLSAFTLLGLLALAPIAYKKWSVNRTDPRQPARGPHGAE